MVICCIGIILAYCMGNQANYYVCINVITFVICVYGYWYSVVMLIVVIGMILGNINIGIVWYFIGISLLGLNRVLYLYLSIICIKYCLVS